MEDLNYDTIHGYRNSHRSLKEGHPFERLSDHEYLRSIGGESDPRNKALMEMFNPDRTVVSFRINQG